MFYENLLFDWLENYVQPYAKQRTYTRYKEIVEQHIIPHFKNIQVNEITPYIVQCFISDLLKNGNLKTKKGLAPSSVNSVITIIQSALKFAHSLGYTNIYIGDKIKRPRMSEKKIECFSKQEQKSIENFILEHRSSRHFGILFCLYTGLRIGELLALEWSDIDLVKGELQVSKSCHYAKGTDGEFQRITDTPKTKSSIRIIPIPKQLLPMLKTLKKKSRSILVVSNGEHPISLRSYQRTFSLMLERLKINHRGFHALRHTFATRALECGMDVKTLSEILGHKNPSVTLNRYAHSLMAHKKEMMNKLGMIL